MKQSQRSLGSYRGTRGHGQTEASTSSEDYQTHTKRTPRSTQRASPGRRQKTQEEFFAQLSDYFGCDIHNFNTALSMIQQVCDRDSTSSEDLTSRLESTTSMLERSEKENRKLQKALQKYEALFTEASELGDDLEGEDPARLALMIKKLELSLDRKESDIEDLTRLVEQLKLQNKELADQELKAKDQLIMDSHIQLAKTESQRLVNENAELTEMVAKMRARIAELTQQTEILAKELASRNEDIENLVKYGDKKNDDLQEAKQAIRDLKETITQKDVKIANMATEISELKLRTVENAHVNVETPKVVPPKQDSQQTDELLASISTFEEVFEQQSEEIQGLYEAKTKMVRQMRRIQELLRANEAFTNDVIQQTKQLEQENDELRKAIRNTNNKRDQETSEVVQQVIPLLPEKVKREIRSLLHENADVTAHVITALISSIQENEKVIEELTQNKNNLESQNAALVDELNGFVRYVRKVGNHWGAEDESPRDMILSECARLSTYLEEFSSANQASPKELAELAMSALRDFDTDQSPFAELLALVSVLVEVNSILLDNVDELKIAQSQGLCHEEREELMSQIDELQHYKLQADEVESQAEEIKHAEKVMAQLKQDYEQRIASLERESAKAKNELKLFKKQCRSERGRFYKRADKVVDEIEHRVVENQMEYEENLGKLNDENQEYRDTIERLRDEHGNDIQKLADIIIAKKEKIKLEKEKNRSLQENLHELNSQLLQWQHKCAQKDADIDDIKTANAELNEKLDRISGKAQRRKEELKFVQSEKVDVIDEIRQRNEELKEKYDSVICQLETDLSKTRGEYESMSQELKTVSEVKQQLLMEKARLSVSEKALRMKVEALTSALERERADYQARKAAMQASFNGTVQAKEKELVEYKSAFSEVVTESLHMSPDDVSVQDFASAVNDRIEEIREQKSVSIECKACDKLADELEKKDAEIKSLRGQISEFVQQNKKLRDVDAKLANASSENAAWEKWSKSLYSQVTLSPAPKLATASEIRSALEDSVLSSVSHGPMNRKLDILRSEKKLLNRFRINAIRGYSDRSKCRSLRPVMIVMIFKKRVEQLSGKAVPRLTKPKPPRASIVPVNE